MRRPFVTLCIFLIIGIMGAHFLKYYIEINYLIYLCITSVIVLLVYERGFIIVFLCSVIILGAYVYRQSVEGDLLLKSANDDIMIKAKILKEGSFKNRFIEYEIEILSVMDPRLDKEIKVNKNAQLQFFSSSLEDSIFIVNDVIKINNFKVTKLLDNISNNELNRYEIFLKSKGIEYIIETIPDNIMAETKEYNRQNSLRLTSYKMKVYIEDFLDSTLDFEKSDILKSIIFGNQGYLSRDRLDIFSKTGTAHIMAVSGLHVGLIVMIVDKFLKLLRIGRNKRLCFTIAVLIFYSYMVYFPMSIIRAGAMYMLFSLAYFLHKRYDSINTLFLIAFILLIYRPMTIFSVSFQLSFTATLSILVLGPMLNKLLARRLGGISSLLSVTLAAQIGTLPIMVYHFKQISIISIVTNLLIVPLLAPILTIAFISIFFGVISFRLGFYINQINNQLLHYIDLVSQKCAIIPYSSLEVNEIKGIYIFGYYLVLVGIYCMNKKKEILDKQKISFKEEGLMNTYEL